MESRSQSSSSNNSSDSEEPPSPPKKKKYSRIIIVSDSSADSEDEAHVTVSSSTNVEDGTPGAEAEIPNIHDQPTQLIHKISDADTSLTKSKSTVSEIIEEKDRNSQVSSTNCIDDDSVGCEEVSSSQNGKTMEDDGHKKSGYEEEHVELDDGSEDEELETEKVVAQDAEIENASEVSDEEVGSEKNAGADVSTGSESEASSGSESISDVDTLCNSEISDLFTLGAGEDSLLTIQFPVLPEGLEPQVHVLEEIYSPLEFSIYLFKLSQRDRRRHFVPVEFVTKILELNLGINTRRYVAQEERFIFSVLVYEQVIALLSQLRIKPQEQKDLGRTKNGRCSRVISALQNYYEINLRKLKTQKVIDNKLLGFLMGFQDLRDYQIEAIDFAISRHGRCMFADESGMGKRVEAIVTGIFYKEDWPMLIVCAPARIVDWRKELLRQHIKKLKIVEILKLEDLDCEVLQGCRDLVIIIGYQTLQDPAVVDGIKKLEAKVLILDESHRIKHINTKTTKIVRHLTKRAKRRFLLTANPAMGVPAELFRQLHALDRKTFKDHMDFADQYCGIYKDEKGAWHVSRQWRVAKNLEELKQLMFGTVVIRHFREDYSPKYIYLPTINREKVFLNFTADERTRRLLGNVVYQESQLEHAILDAEGAKETSIFKWFKRSGIAKLLEICQYLDSIDYVQNKVIIYARHKKVMAGIEELLKRKRVDHLTFRGDYENRKDLSDEFNSNPKIRVALLSLDISKPCINLSSANLIIFAELYWVPEALFRNEDRSYLLNSVDNLKRTIEVKYLIAKERDPCGDQIHIDSSLWEMISGKMDVLRKLGLLRHVFTLPEIVFEAVPNDVTDDLKFSDMSSNDGSDSDEFNPSDESDAEKEEEDADAEEVPSSELDEGDDNDEGEKEPDDWHSGFNSIIEQAKIEATQKKGDDSGEEEDEAAEEKSAPAPPLRTMRLRSEGNSFEDGDKNRESSEESSSSDSGVVEIGTCEPHDPQEDGRRDQALGSADSETDANSDSEGSLDEFVVEASSPSDSTSSSDADAGDDDDDDVESDGKKQNKRKRQVRKRRATKSSSDSEDREKEIKKKSKGYLF